MSCFSLAQLVALAAAVPVRGGGEAEQFWSRTPVPQTLTAERAAIARWGAENSLVPGTPSGYD